MSKHPGDFSGVDIRWDTEDLFLGDLGPDSFYLFDRMLETTLDEVASRDGVGPWFGGRVLDIACGAAGDVAQLVPNGWEAHGMEPSSTMLGFAREREAREGGEVRLVRGIAEALPYADDSFDRVMCKGSFDHFARPRAAIEEIRRVLRPNGRFVMSLANFESLSCRLGRRLHPVIKATNADFRNGSRPYWVIPGDHTFKGDLPTILRLVDGVLDLEGYQGVSLMWAFPWWVGFLKAVPDRAASVALRLANRMGRQHPSKSDVIVASWVKRPR
ncbi:MAG: methyltransferase domain-containing protein [Dehalococcoidia bacterium]